MAGTRSSQRLNSSPQSGTGAAGTKRKAEDASPAKKSKRGRPSKEQKTLEETVSAADDHAETNGDDVGDEGIDVEELNAGTKGNGEPAQDSEKGSKQAEAESKDDTKNAFDSVKADEGEEGKTTAKESDTKDNGHADISDVKADAVEEDKAREEALPSNILEKGIIYFFTRGRVGVEDPSNVQELQRSYFVLRPLPDGAKLTDGAIQDVGNNRLIALPKKVWPKSGKDRFMVFVEKAKTSMETLKEEFFQGSDYATQTQGTRHQQGVTPLGEGVYAITTTGATGGGQGTTHLAYMLTIPSELGDVQKDVGLGEKGSFILSVKNPESSAPSYALPAKAEYPKEIVEEFGARAWLPANPKHIDYDNAAVLIIGESFEKATEEGGKDDSKEPKEELEKLEHEDELRVENINGDDAIFADLGISKKDYAVMTTW